MSRRTTIVLALALALALALVWRDAQRGGTREPPAPAENVKRIFRIAEGEVIEIVVRRGERELRLARSAASWTGSPDPARATDFLHAVLDLAEILPIESGPSDLADLGLAPPRAVITLQGKRGPLAELLVGNRNPAATGIYVQIGKGGRVVLSGAVLEWEIDKLFRELSATP